MNKKQREQFAKKTLALLQRYTEGQIETRHYREVIPHVHETTLTSATYGRVYVAIYLPTEAKEHPWVACRFLDWDAPYGQDWRGWPHWKNNLLNYSNLGVDGWLDEIQQHLATMDIQPSSCAASA